ncbi:GxxExxY protein [Anabaena azotica]|uniref:GxxExxY protein n=1 Tax=Anabaena azotica TaxID=197653 RepID=UPI0039A6F39E
MEKRFKRRGTQRLTRRNTENELTGLIIGSSMRIHTALGPGLLESAYEECLDYELKKANLKDGIKRVANNL